jgi:hypothetical protein
MSKRVADLMEVPLMLNWFHASKSADSKPMF